MSATAHAATAIEIKTPGQVIDAIRNIGTRDGDDDSPIFSIERGMALYHMFADLDTFRPSDEIGHSRVNVKYEWQPAEDFKALQIGGSAFNDVGSSDSGYMWEIPGGIETVVALYDCIGGVLRAMVEAGAYTMPVDQKEAWRRAGVRKAAEDAAVQATVTKPADADGRKRTKRAPKPLRRKAVR